MVPHVHVWLVLQEGRDGEAVPDAAAGMVATLPPELGGVELPEVCRPLLEHPCPSTLGCIVAAT